MQIGRLRHRVTIQRRTLSQGGGGEITTTWADFATVWAEVRTPAGVERAAPEVDQVRGALTHTVRVRSGNGAILPTMRVVWGSRTLEIVTVTDPDNRGESQVLLCNEILEP